MARRNIPPYLLHQSEVAELALIQRRRIQTLLVDNQRLAATHVALKQELALSDQEVRHLSAALDSVKVESDAQFRQVLEKAVKIEGEVKGVREMEVELGRVREDVRKMEEDRRELVGKLEEVEAELRRVRVDAEEVERVGEEIEVTRREILKGRAAIEHENKLHAINVEIGKIFEENIVSVAHEFQKVLAEVTNAEKMERAAAAAAIPGPAYASHFGNSDVGYTANSYAGSYAAQQFQGNVSSGPQYSSVSRAHSPNGTQQNQLP